VKGPRIPDWGGEGGTVEEGYYAGLPGKGFALILKELWTNVSPTGAYWNPVEVVEDTRLDPYETDRSRYVFQVQGEGAARVRVRLLFRRAFKELMDQKGWTDPDILMGEVVLDIGRSLSGCFFYFLAFPDKLGKINPDYLPRLIYNTCKTLRRFDEPISLNVQTPVYGSFGLVGCFPGLRHPPRG